MKPIIPPTKTPHQRIKEFTPLILVLASIGFIESLIVLQTGIRGIPAYMRIFMGLFFFIFAVFKLLDLDGFAMNYAEYDVIAKRSKTYAYLYPFIELTLSYLYLTNLYPLQTNIATAIVMGIGSIGVINAVWIKKQKIHCACLGAVVKLPMTTVTVIEDVGMGLMALFMIFIT
jgi:hypothetical protein